MPAALRHASLPDADEWITVDEAAKLTGESLRVWQRRAHREAIEASRCGRRSLAMKVPPTGGEGKPAWLVSRKLDDRLSRYPSRQSRDERVREALSAKYPHHLIDRGLRRNHWLQRWRSLCQAGGATDRTLAERVVAEARAIESDFRISVRSLYGWWRRYNRLGETGILGVEGLIDRYGAGDSGETPSTRSPDAVAFFLDLYHTENKVAIRTCHEVTLHEARRKGWTWPASYSATKCWLEQHDERSRTCLMREGKRAWAHKYLPHLQINYTKIEPGYMYQGDHSPCDFWVSYKGRHIRPWFTTFQDMRSRCIVGWHLGPSPHQDAILAAMRMAFLDWGIPSVCRIDNGKDFTSKPVTGFTKRERDRLRRALGPEWQQIARRSEGLIECSDSRWLGVSGELGIELIFAIPYSPWSKGVTERFYGTFQGQFSKTQPTYCGDSTRHKPECLPAILREGEAVPTLEQARRDLGKWLDIYHRTAHGGLDGNKPLDVWQTASRLRRALGDELTFLMDIRGLYKVGANGVRVTVGSGPIRYGAKSAALKRHVGREVLVAVNADDVGCAWAYTPDRERRKLIGRLEPNEYIEPYTCADDAREAIAESRREQSVMHKAARASAGRTKTACQRMNEHSRAKRATLLAATGTEDKHPHATIVPVQTGFEGVSKPSRSDFETYRPVDSGELEDLFDDTPAFGVVEAADDEGMEDLFIDEPADSEADEGLEGLL